jgi:hypothetical protein
MVAGAARDTTTAPVWRDRVSALLAHTDAGSGQKKKNKRRVVCGHFRTHQTRVVTASGTMVVEYCTKCRVAVRSTPV